MSLLLSKLAPLSAMLIACGPTLSGGLANVPASSNANLSESQPYDVIANGADSCDREAAGASPLRGRTTTCARAQRASEARPFAPRELASPVTPHLPCWAAADPWPAQVTLAGFASSCGQTCSPTLVACRTQ